MDCLILSTKRFLSAFLSFLALLLYAYIKLTHNGQPGNFSIKSGRTGAIFFRPVIKVQVVITIASFFPHQLSAPLCFCEFKNLKSQCPPF